MRTSTAANPRAVRVTALSLGLILVVGLCALSYPVAILSVSTAHAIEITPLVGYQISGSLEVEYQAQKGTLDIGDGVDYGLLISWPMEQHTYLEVLYNRSTVRVTPTGALVDAGIQPFDMTIQYFHFGGSLELELGGSTYPFGSMSVGATHFGSAEGDGSTRFSFILTGGFKVELGKKVEARAQARLFTNVFSSGTPLFCEQIPGGDCFILQNGQFVFQGDVSFGLTFIF